MSDVFTALERVLLEGDSLTFKISRRGHKLVALVIPVLPPPPSLPSDVERIRDGLSVYLCLEMSAEEMDAEFSDRVRAFAAAREAPRRTFSRVLEELAETHKAAQAALTAQRTKRKGATPAASLPPSPAEPPEAQEDAPTAPSPVAPPASESERDTNQPLSLF
jgi:hypothetical protein